MNQKTFEYNDEFLRSGGESFENAQRDFSLLMFALKNDYVCKTFFDLDHKARLAKARMQNLGVISILFGLAALIFAAIDIAYLAPQIELIKYSSKTEIVGPLALVVDQTTSDTDQLKQASLAVKWVAGVAALLGVASFVIGFYGGGFGKQKRAWLYLRMTCEDIRQWRWRYFLDTLEDIVTVAGDPNREGAYIARLEEQFKSFLTRNEADLVTRFASVLDDGNDLESSVSIELPDLGKIQSKPKGSDHLRLALDAYEAIRVRGQRRYADYIVLEDGSIRTHPKRQQHVLEAAEQALIVAVVVLHVMVIFGALLDIPAFKSVAIHLLAISAALTTLAVGAVEKGLRPTTHLERFRSYRSRVMRIQVGLRNAASAEERLINAIDLEVAAYDEMRDFLRESDKSKFVL